MNRRAFVKAAAALAGLGAGVGTYPALAAVPALPVAAAEPELPGIVHVSYEYGGGVGADGRVVCTTRSVP